MYPGLLDGRAVPHLHGGFTDPRYDGHPHSWYTKTGDPGSHFASLPGNLPGEAILEYSNEQCAAMLWYHDHEMGITRLNVYAGLAGLYFVRDGYDTGAQPDLPSGLYEIPLVLQDKTFNIDGSLFYPVTSGLPAPYPHPVWVPEFFGDTPFYYYAKSPQSNPQGPNSGDYRVLRGGSWHGYSTNARTGFRAWLEPYKRDVVIGFRCVGP